MLDEAYVHYSVTPGYIHLAAEHENLAVLRTFSKAFGLAGLRIGFGIAHRPIIDALLAVETKWNTGQLQIAGSIASLDDDAHIDRTVATIFRMVPGSRSNFFLVEILDPGSARPRCSTDCSNGVSS